MAWILRLVQFLKGTLYYRFALFICVLGASFIAPQLWEGVLWLVTRMVNLLYQNAKVDEYEMTHFAPDPIDYVIGVIIILIGIILFIYFYKKQGKNGHDDYLAISKLWVGLRDIYDVNPNMDDVKIAISVLNVTSKILIDTSPKTIKQFKEDRLENFNTLYQKLMNNNYIVSGKNSKELLNDNVKQAKKIINGTA